MTEQEWIETEEELDKALRAFAHAFTVDRPDTKDRA